MNEQKTEIVNDASPVLAREQAMIDSQIATAKRYPRVVSKFKEECMTMATMDEETASGCFYAIPRGNRPITGPSVRLAEIVASAWGNIVSESAVNNVDDKFVYVRASCRDLERNVSVGIEIKRKITDRNGKRYNDDMIQVTGQAACAIALRNAIFKVIPGVFYKDVYDAARKLASGGSMSLGERRAKVFKGLIGLGAMQDRILAVINRDDIDDVTSKDIELLIGMGTSIKEGTSNVDEVFPEIKPSLDEQIMSKAKAKPKAKKEPEIRPDTPELSVRAKCQNILNQLYPGNKDEQDVCVKALSAFKDFNGYSSLQMVSDDALMPLYGNLKKALE